VERRTLDPRWVGALIVVLLATGAGMWFGRDVSGSPPADRLPPVTPATSVSTPADVSVHVAGWVVRPGVVRLPEGARVADAIAAAGGFRPDATVEAVNLAAPVADGQQIVVPGPGGESEAGATVPGVESGPVSLSVATPAQLETLPGVGPVLAGRIVAHRESSGPFRAVEDLLEVPGIGEATLAAIEEAGVVP
jgi:competence protein ComEA